MRRRNYATPSGVKELQIREALNDAMAEELESNPKVFLLGEEVGLYNGAYETLRNCDSFNGPNCFADTRSPEAFWTASETKE